MTGILLIMQRLENTSLTHIIFTSCRQDVTWKRVCRWYYSKIIILIGIYWTSMCSTRPDNLDTGTGSLDTGWVISGTEVCSQVWIDSLDSSSVQSTAVSGTAAFDMRVSFLVDTDLVFEPRFLSGPLLLWRPLHTQVLHNRFPWSSSWVSGNPFWNSKVTSNASQRLCGL